jgi:hypothetical protein
MNLNPPVYCVTHQNPERRNRMSHRFTELKIPARFVESPGDCMAGHLAALEQFSNTAEMTAIVMEDDVMLRRDYAKHVGMITAAFHAASLDVLMLGYLWPFPARYEIQGSWIPECFPQKITPFAFFGYPDDIWGAQMYMISRSHAQHVITGYGNHTGYEQRSLSDPTMIPWSPDWIITKTGHRALSVPMLGIEEGVPSGGDEFTHDYRAKTFTSNYDPNIHI